MDIILADINPHLVRAWREHCSDLEDVTIQHGSIFEVDCDAIVSPANSYGFMDGGLDLLISEFFGWHVQERLQEKIRTKHHGELLVGQAELVATDHPGIPYVIAAPTMRVPMILGEETVNVYLATRAVLLLVKFGALEDGTPVSEVVRTVAVPGMGTGVGRVPYRICARQMKAAIHDVVLEDTESEFPRSWLEAQKRHQVLYSALTRDLQFKK